MFSKGIRARPVPHKVRASYYQIADTPYLQPCGLWRVLKTMPATAVMTATMISSIQ